MLYCTVAQFLRDKMIESILSVSELFTFSEEEQYKDDLCSVTQAAVLNNRYTVYVTVVPFIMDNQKITSRSQSDVWHGIFFNK